MLDASLLPLHDGRARLRPLHAADAVAFAEGTADAEVQAFGHLPESDYTPDSVLTMMEEQAWPGLERGDVAVLAIATEPTDEFAGSLVLFDVSEDSVEVGFWLHPERRGSGLASAALELAAQFAARSSLVRLTARTEIRNSSSQRVLERAGFTLEGSMTDTAPSGKEVEVCLYSRSIRG
ncbi:RimJ/RimL family protein N-acetyltransferase [Microbacterium resistens]|uniref:RimJ/RimL family protein N-acetyltransferase n=1 Tax=Microbacterium resistens TaxID=156977 RepID=A0ABU1SCR7_9MICO|nr:GNAT family protein [Microbacterium resistens]MDR6867402.1 RimJ/RimL family protein N-acetyltransferase [Microbacterium resistens]